MRLVRLARAGACAATGREAPLRREIRGALAAGISPADLREALLQTYLFAGFPRAINALTVLHEETAGVGTFHLEKPLSIAAYRKRGEKLCRLIYGRDYAPLMRRMNQLHPDLAEWILIEGYGKTLSRRWLTARERELLVIPTLAALGAWKQVPSHLGGALNAGATKAEITSVLAGQKGVVPAASIRRAQSFLQGPPRAKRRV